MISNCMTTEFIQKNIKMHNRSVSARHKEIDSKIKIIDVCRNKNPNPYKTFKIILILTLIPIILIDLYIWRRGQAQNAWRFMDKQRYCLYFKKQIPERYSRIMKARPVLQTLPWCIVNIAIPKPLAQLRNGELRHRKWSKNKMSSVTTVV